MLYFIHGDPNKIFEKAQKMADMLLKKKPDAAFFKLNLDNFSEDKMTELLGGQGLFANKYIVSMSRLLEKSETADFILDHLKEIKESENIFIWTEEKLTKPVLKKIEKVSEKIQEFEIKKAAPQNQLNVFKIAELFGQKDKKQLWLTYNQLIQEVPPEEIYGILWWQVKSMLLASKTNTAAEAGMKDFPYKKAKGCLKNFAENEIEKASSDLINIYHRSRLEGEDLVLNLEKFILSY
jgi:hypothetical protein